MTETRRTVATLCTAVLMGACAYLAGTELHTMGAEDVTPSTSTVYVGTVPTVVPRINGSADGMAGLFTRSLTTH